MNRFFKFLTAAVLVAASAATLAACGGNGEGGTDNPSVPAGSKEYVFEAEYVDCSNIGNVDGWSGGGSNTDVIAPDMGDHDTSNGFYVTYLYTNNATLEFKINSDKAVNDAKIVWRLSTEGADYTISTSNYKVTLNGTELQYAPVQFKNVPGVGDMLPFKDYVLATNVSLVEGENIIRLITSNTTSLGGTTTATAPIIDCIKITTSATLTWNPVESNLDNF